MCPYHYKSHGLDSKGYDERQGIETDEVARGSCDRRRNLYFGLRKHIMKKFSDVENISWQPKPHKGTLGFIVDRLSPADLSLLKHREQFRFHEDARQQGSACFLFELLLSYQLWRDIWFFVSGKDFRNRPPF